MSATSMRAGSAIAIYKDDGQGRRLLVVNDTGKGYVTDPVILAKTKQEARQAIAALTQLAEELPP